MTDHDWKLVGRPYDDDSLVLYACQHCPLRMSAPEPQLPDPKLPCITDKAVRKQIAVIEKQKHLKYWAALEEYLRKQRRPKAKRR